MPECEELFVIAFVELFAVECRVWHGLVGLLFQEFMIYFME